GAVLQKVQKGDFPPPRQVNGLVSAALEAVCLKAMALRPQERYATPRELAEEIERWLADEPVRAYREPLPLRLGRWGRRHPALVTGAAALVFMALVALGVGGLLLSQEKEKTLTEQKARLEEQERAGRARDERVVAQADTLLDAAPSAVPVILNNLEPYRQELLPRLRDVRSRPEPAGQTEAARRIWQQHRTRAALALLPDDPDQVPFLRQRLLDEEVEPEEALLIRGRLQAHGARLAPGLWAEVNRPGV